MEINDEEETINKGLKFLAKSSFFVIVSMILSKIFLYLYRIIIAKHYGPEIYGFFALSVMLLGWFRVASTLGMKQGLLRQISLFRGKNQEKRIQHLFNISFFVLICTSLLAGFLLFFFSEFIAVNIFSNTKLTSFLKIFGFVVPLAVLGEAFLSALRAYEKIAWFSFISNVLGNLIKLGALVLLIIFGVNSSSVPISYLFGAFSIFVVAYLVCKFTLKGLFKPKKEKIITKKSKTELKEMFSYAGPLIFYDFISLIFYWIDSFMVGIFEPVEQVGFYNAAVPIALLLYLPTSFFGQLFFPLVAKEFSKGNLKVVKQLSQQVGKWIFMIVLPLFILFMVFPGAVINLLFGEEYLVATTALRFLSVGTLFAATFALSRELLFIKGKSKLLLSDMVFAAILNITLNAILVPNWGISGAGFATMISMIVLNFLFFVQTYKHLTIIPLRRRIFRIALMTTLTTLLLLSVKSLHEINLSFLILCGIFFVATYILLILTTKCLDKNDIYVLKSAFKRLKI